MVSTQKVKGGKLWFAFLLLLKKQMKITEHIVPTRQAV
jgi:hypothetical protein